MGDIKYPRASIALNGAPDPMLGLYFICLYASEIFSTPDLFPCWIRYWNELFVEASQISPCTETVVIQNLKHVNEENNKDAFH